jgi:hypothetical protein
MVSIFTAFSLLKASFDLKYEAIEGSGLKPPYIYIKVAVLIQTNYTINDVRTYISECYTKFMKENNRQAQENRISKTPKKLSPIMILLIVIVALSAIGIKLTKHTTIVSPTSEKENPVSNNFCLDQNYCNMNNICSILPPNHGFCTSDIECTKYNLCGRKETLMKSGIEVMFEKSIAAYNEKTRVGYMLVRNTNNSKQDVNIKHLECLNFEGLCNNIKVTYPLGFQINPKDVVIFPIYIENQKNLTGLVSLEFTFKIGGKSSMVSVDLIFNNDKTCIYQWGGLETSRKIYFQEKSKIDWTQDCQ